MKTCKACKQEKELILFAKSKTCKDGYDTTCKQCRKEQNKERKNNRNKKSKQNLKVGFINPTHPIPVKKFADDGYGGKWKFDITKLTNDQLTFAKQHGLINHMSKSRIPCYQVKHVNLVSMQLFCDFVGMNRKAIIHFDKEENVKPVYVVNLYHQNIRMVLR